MFLKLTFNEPPIPKHPGKNFLIICEIINFDERLIINFQKILVSVSSSMLIFTESWCDRPLPKVTGDDNIVYTKWYSKM